MHFASSRLQHGRIPRCSSRVIPKRPSTWGRLFAAKFAEAGQLAELRLQLQSLLDNADWLARTTHVRETVSGAANPSPTNRGEASIMSGREWLSQKVAAYE
jgi:hypothetical protein